jgi:hypothetical protein
MAETHPIRLSPEEIARAADKFFGPHGLGLDREGDEPNDRRYVGRAGFLEIVIRPAGNNQSRVTIEHQGFEDEVHRFRRTLSRQAAAETSI